MGPRADPLKESNRPGVSVVADILEGLEDEGEEVSRMVVAGGQRQP